MDWIATLLTWRNLISLIDILVIWLVIYELMVLLKGTRAVQLFKGILIIIVIKLISWYVGLSTVSWVMDQVINWGVIAMVIIFQPEIRRGLEHLGRGTMLTRNRVANQAEEEMIKQLDQAIQYMSKRRIGALIAIQMETGLEEYIETGIPLDAEITGALLINTFIPNTPLHDGAVIIKNNRVAVAAAYLVSVWLAGGKSSTIIPFVGEVDLGWGYWILAAILIVGVVNAVNFTDGIDGLNASVTFFVCIFLMVIAGVMNAFSMSIMAVAAAAACMGFLVWNFNPAKVFMGDTGSLFLGGMVCALAFGLNLPILLLPLGIVYFMEILSVVLQVSYFKLTHGKRLFKMSPIHHHFEMCGWSEMKICLVFSLITAVGGAIALLLVFFGV